MYWRSRHIPCKLRSQLRAAASLLILVVLVAALAASAAAQSPVASDGIVTTKVLVRGAPIHGTNGLMFDSQNRLHIASVFSRAILVIDPKTGKIIDTIGRDQGVQGPDDLTFGPDGSLYWTDILVGEVGRLEPDGSLSKQFVAPFVNPITFSDDGRLFVAQAFLDDGLFELDPELKDPPRLILGTGNPAYHLNAMDFGPDGLLYAPRQQLDQIVRIDVDTGAVEVLTDQFHGACKFDSLGRLHVAVDDRVVHFDPSTGEVTTIAMLPDGLDNLAFDAEGKIYVSNFRDGSIHQILPSGKARLVSPGGLIAPGGIVVLPDAHSGESIFVTDFFTLREFDGLNGRPGVEGRDFFFDAPFTAAADGENLILSSWFGNTVEVWNPETQAVLEVYNFDVPLNAMRFQGDLVVAELATASVVRLDPDTGGRDVLASGLPVPTGLASTEDDLWAADWASGTVWQIVADGVLQQPPVLVAAGLVLPEGLAVDQAGSLLVVESGAGRLSRIDPDTGAVNTVVEDLALGAPAAPGWPPTWFFNGVAVGQRGDIYVTGDTENVVYRIRVRP